MPFLNASLIFRSHELVVSCNSRVVHVTVDCQFHNFWLVIFAFNTLTIIFCFYVSQQNFPYRIIWCLFLKRWLTRSATSSSRLRLRFRFVRKHEHFLLPIFFLFRTSFIFKNLFNIIFIFLFFILILWILFEFNKFKLIDHFPECFFLFDEFLFFKFILIRLPVLIDDSFLLFVHLILFWSHAKFEAIWFIFFLWFVFIKFIFDVMSLIRLIFLITIWKGLVFDFLKSLWFGESLKCWTLSFLSVDFF